LATRAIQSRHQIWQAIMRPFSSSIMHSPIAFGPDMDDLHCGNQFGCCRWDRWIAGTCRPAAHAVRFGGYLAAMWSGCSPGILVFIKTLVFIRPLWSSDSDAILDVDQRYRDWPASRSQKCPAAHRFDGVAQTVEIVDHWRPSWSGTTVWRGDPWIQAAFEHSCSTRRSSQAHQRDGCSSSTFGEIDL